MSNERWIAPREWQWLTEDEPGDLNQLEGNTRELIDVVGFHNALKLIEYFGGTAIYIPKWERAFKILRNRRIVAEFDGFNTRELARRYRVSESTVRNIVLGEAEESQQELW